MQSDTRSLCEQCDLLVEIGTLTEGCKASCPRCGHVISCLHRNALERIQIFSISAVICLFFSNLFGFVQMSVQGQVRQISLLGTVQELFSLQEWALGAFTLIVIMGLPTLFVILLVWLVISIKLRLVSLRTFWLLHIISYLRFWNMAEIFFLGILISMVKIASLAQVQVGLSFWAYAMFNLFLMLATLHLDKHQLALAIRLILRHKQVSPEYLEASEIAHT